ncbi:MAG: integration host factor subunit beta [Planctomycetes bacterium]|nr:integration host factor subunit beta [Planctomycetota bacterium]
MDPEPQTITKKELVNRIADQTHQTKVVVKDILQLFLDEIIEELARGNRLEFREFGVFEVRERAARRAQNPRTLEKVFVPSKRVVKFKVGRLMRERICDERPDEREARLKAQKGAPEKGGASKGKGGSQPPPIPKPPPSNSPF